MALEVVAVVRPAERRERPKRRAEPGVEDVVVLPQRLIAGFLPRLFLRLRDEHAAILRVPGGNPMAPPQLPRHAPGLDVLEPVEPGLRPSLRHDPDVALLHGLKRWKRELGGVDVPLIGEPRLDHHARPVAVGGRDHAIVDADDRAFRFEPLDDRFARLLTREAKQFLRDRAVLSLDDVCLRIEHVEHVGRLYSGAAAHFEVVEVVSRRDLHRARAELGIGMLVGDDRDQPAGDRVADDLADHGRISLVLGMHRDGHVGEHRLRPRRRDFDCARAIRQRVAEVPELTLDLASLDLEVTDRRLKFRVPVHQALVAVDQPALVQFDEDMGDGALIALVHRETLVLPVARRAQAAELAGDRATGLRLPFPDMLKEGLASNLGALEALAVEVALDHHLGRDPGMIRADHPQCILAAHPLAPGEDILQRDIERVADVQ